MSAGSEGTYTGRGRDTLGDALPSQSRWGERIGPVYTAARLVEVLGVSHEAISGQTESCALWGLTTADGHTVYPARQFTADFEVLPGLSDVLRVFNGVPVDDWSLASWLLSGQLDLSGKSVLDWLEEGTGRGLETPLLLAERTARRWSR